MNKDKITDVFFFFRIQSVTMGDTGLSHQNKPVAVTYWISEWVRYASGLC
jgi:hypothetical protein